ncbi:MAG: hypothetical protein P8129_09850, partial [Anaerolineae bacterium]
MNRANPTLRSVAPWAAILLALALSLGACAAAPLTPYPTAIPLAATASPSPRPTRAAPTATTAAAAPTATPTATSTSAVADSVSTASELLARRTVEDLLARLQRGEVETIVTLYLSDEAVQAGQDQIILGLSGGERQMAQAELLEFRPATASSYEARVLLHWTGDAGAASQPLTLRLVYRRGLWLVQQISLGELHSAAPTAAAARPPTSARSSATRAAQATGRLVFQVSSGGPIYLVDADGSHLHRLTDGLDPAWAPDGKSIAFTRWRYPGGVYLIEPGGSERRVVDGNRLKEVAWAPDGRRIAFTLNMGSSDPTEVCFFGYCFTIPAFSAAQLWTADLESGSFLNLPLDDQVIHAPAWSPSGERIVYAGHRGLAWIDLDGMETGHLSGGSAWDNSPAFSPDGTRIA